ncbi:hypothetical protein [Leucobacter tenebrionis]|nr:hypothetical protein [Leucobacter tenebrionis]
MTGSRRTRDDCPVAGWGVTVADAADPVAGCDAPAGAAAGAGV